VLTSYGRSSGFCLDPIEKKPLNHFLPGTPVLSFGTAGCNLACKFCQNWDMSKSREMDTLADAASAGDPGAGRRGELGCRSVAYTYNDPVIFHGVRHRCGRRLPGTRHPLGGGHRRLHLSEPRREFFAHMDAANVDLKAFTEEFYWKICGGTCNRCWTRWSTCA
jgi:pyruvate formate lyase activating enzyme